MLFQSPYVHVAYGVQANLITSMLEYCLSFIIQWVTFACSDLRKLRNLPTLYYCQLSDVQLKSNNVLQRLLVWSDTSSIVCKLLFKCIKQSSHCQCCCNHLDQISWWVTHCTYVLLLYKTLNLVSWQTVFAISAILPPKICDTPCIPGFTFPIMIFHASLSGTTCAP